MNRSDIQHALAQLIKTSDGEVKARFMALSQKLAATPDDKLQELITASGRRVRALTPDQKQKRLRELVKHFSIQKKPCTTN